MKPIEPLEARRLLSTSFNPTTGVLTVTGTTKPDTFQFANGSTTFTVVQTTSGQTTSSTFDRTRVKSIAINLSDGADTVIMGRLPIPATINGGKGNDRISAGAGNDRINGQGGDDYIFGGDGKDTVDGGSQGDDMFGGGGRDTVDYSARTAPLTIGLGTLPDDGEAGEGDNVRSDFEVVLGGAGSDNISHSGTRPINLYGNAGNDTLIGGIAGDYLVGGPGNDSLVGGDGNDVFDVQDGARDTCNGGDGTDSALTSDQNDILDFIP